MRQYRKLRLNVISSLIASGVLATACGGGGTTNAAVSSPESPATIRSSATVLQWPQSLTEQVANATEPMSVDVGSGLIAAPAPTPSTVHAKPRTALYFLSDDMSATTQQKLARYQFVILGTGAWQSPAALQDHVNKIKGINPGIKLAQYVMLMESQDFQSSDVRYPLLQALNANNWWIRDSAGNRTQWTTAYSAYNINITDWAPPDVNGLRWHQIKAKFDNDKMFKNMKGLDYVYVDGFDVPLVDGDWKRIGTNQSRKDADIVSAYRKGNVNYVNSVRALNSGLKFMGNSASSDAPEYKSQLEGVNRECLMGKSWSIETSIGWEAMMASYRTALANTKAPKDVLLGACYTTEDPAPYRYALASALLEDGYLSYAISNYRSTPWFDESDAPLGTAAEAPPTAPTASGIWMRKYTNGLVLVNPSKTTAASINVGSGYKFLKGTIDTVVNNGLPVPNNTVTLQPRSGLVLVRT